MKSLKAVDQRLASLGHLNKYFGRAEVRELPHILSDDEEIECVVTGLYQNGFALLVATNYRLLLIDKKPLFLNMEDIRYDTISEVDFITQFVNAVISVRTMNKTLTFKSIRKRRLRQMTTMIQQKVIELRQDQPDVQESVYKQPPVPELTQLQVEGEPGEVKQQEQPSYQMPAPTQATAPPLVQVEPAAPQAAAPRPPLEQTADQLGAMALTQRRRGLRRFTPYAPYPYQSLTVRRPTTGFYNNPSNRS